MEILASLGVNSTIGIQFCIFLVAFLVLNLLVFKPYLAAYEEREKRTSGQTKAAEGLFEEANKLKEEYASMARTQLEESQAIYAQAKKEAGSVYQEKVDEAKKVASSEVEKARIEIANQLSAASTNIKSEVSSISGIISEKLIGREL